MTIYTEHRALTRNLSVIGSGWSPLQHLSATAWPALRLLWRGALEKRTGVIVHTNCEFCSTVPHQQLSSAAEPTTGSA